MNRAEFLQRTAKYACGFCAATVMAPRLGAATDATATPVDEALKRSQAENSFVNNWLSDLFAAIDEHLDPTARIKLLEACGHGCYKRHKFKQDIAQAGKGDVDKLIQAYKANFGIRREGDVVHITYGGGKCYCPAARNRPARPNDLHCECTRATHEKIWSEALGQPYRIELVETVRRGGKRCHLIVRLT